MPPTRRSAVDAEMFKQRTDTQPSKTGNSENLQKFHKRDEMMAKAHRLSNNGTPFELTKTSPDLVVSRFAEIEARRRESTKASDQSNKLDHRGITLSTSMHRHTPQRARR